MAILLRDYEVTRYGTTLPEAYAKIDRIMVDLARGKALIEVRVYVDETARRSDTDGRSVMGMDKYSMEVDVADLGLDVDAVKKAAYSKLKVQEKFSLGEDV